jgi:HEAT repeat protein
MDPDLHTEAESAIAEIGTNAVRHLTKRILYEPSRLSRHMLDATERLPDNFQQPILRFFRTDRALYEREQLGIEGFRILGPAARGAIPVLIRCLATHSRRDDRPVLMALSCIGEESLPPIVSVMTNLNNPTNLRAEAASWIMRMGMVNSFAASNLVCCIQDKQTEVALNAAYALAHRAMRPDIVLPLLIAHARDTNCANRYGAVEAIGEYGKDARSAIPLLVELLKDPQELVRYEATNSLYKIDRTVLPEGTVPLMPID